ncbi:MAG: hypothetical protein ACREJT_13655, partial [Myxococcota bacterium]
MLSQMLVTPLRRAVCISTTFSHQSERGAPGAAGGGGATGISRSAGGGAPIATPQIATAKQTEMPITGR